ncbi:MAG: alpha/beta hydrolase [Vampirovibrionales bacterium]
MYKPTDDETHALSHEFTTQLMSTAHLVGFKEVPFQGDQNTPLRYIEMEGSRGYDTPSESETPSEEPTEILLFVCGMGGSTLSALPLLTGLRHEFHRMVSLDLRGFGIHSEYGSNFKAAEVHIADLRACLSALKHAYPNSVFTLMGISLGALLLCHTLAKSDTRTFPSLQSLVLLAPAFAPHPNTFKPLSILKAILAFLLNPRATMRLPYTLTALTKNPVYLDTPVMQPPTELPLTYLLSVKQLQDTVMQCLPLIELPVMMVVPMQDKVCDPHAMQKGFCRLSDTHSHTTNAFGHRLSLYQSSYHDVILEPELPWMLNDLISWLDQCRLTTPLTPVSPTP